MAPTTDFEFKVQTVKWFGILCALVIVGMISLGFWYLDRIVTLSQAYQSTLDFQAVLKAEKPDLSAVTLGLEHDGLAMRNKRGVSALDMRAYSQFLAIVAGTVLALLGAVFVLARVDGPQVSSEVSWSSVKWLLTSASPGIVVAIVGALLVGSVVFIGGDPIRVSDGAIYIKSSGNAGSIGTGSSPSTADFFKTMEENLRDLRKAE